MRRLALLALAALTAALVVGCGGGSSSGGGGEPAGMVPASAPVFIEADFAPEAEEAEAVNELSQSLAGIDNLGDYIVEKLESSTLGEEEVDFEKEVEPWLGEKAGLYLTDYEQAEFAGDDFRSFGAAVETTNSDEAEEFIKERAENVTPPSESGEFEGHEYWHENGAALVGVVNDWLVFARDEKAFEEIVKTAEGEESLAETEKYTAAVASLPSEGLGRLYVDIGGLVESSGGSISSEDELGFALLGIEPRKATLAATVIPKGGQIEADISTNVTTTPQGGDASALLESMPATAVGAFASSEIGKSFGAAIHELSEKGIPGQVPPGEFEQAFEALGINLKATAESIGEAAAFVEGQTKDNLGAAAVITTDDPSEAQETITKVGLLLRASNTPGVTAISGNVTGFSVHSEKLGSKPLIFGVSGNKFVIAYGPRAAAQALRKQTKTLGQTADFEAAKSALGSTPIGAFVEGGPALRLVESLLKPEERAFVEAGRQNLQKIAYLGAGTEVKGSNTLAKLIIGVQ